MEPGGKAEDVSERIQGLAVGRHGPNSAEQARYKAAQVLDDIKTGSEPVLADGAPSADTVPTVADVAEWRLRELVMVRCKPTTVRHGRHPLDRHLLPARVPSAPPRSWA